MGLGYVLLLVGVAGSFFGCGIFCGYYLFKERQVISLTLAHGISNLAKPVSDLQSTLRQIEIGVWQHGQRMTADAGALEAPLLPAVQAQIIQGLIEANRGFEQQASVWADDVRRTRERLTQSVQPPSTDDDGERIASETTPDPHSPSASSRLSLSHRCACRSTAGPRNRSVFHQ
jgi:hypothetical protein